MTIAIGENVFEAHDVVVACDGGGGALGHPLVYLNIEASGEVECPYCGRIYRLTPGAKPRGGH